MDTYVIWARKEGRKLNIEASCARYAPLPYGAKAITVVERQDLVIMLDWCRKKRDNGWSVERMRAACEMS